mmetsp:Transcript_39191/g.110791  ORF Transcript_39191/g.110791 Transcript_39191/m.110791 type:complete len:269 (+) Transcript_39191:821-1627(+)
MVELAREAMRRTFTVDSSIWNPVACRQLRSSNWVVEIVSLCFNSAKSTLPLPLTAESTPKYTPPPGLPRHRSTVCPLARSTHSPSASPQRGAVMRALSPTITIGHRAANLWLTASWVGGGVSVFFSDTEYMIRAPICMSYGTTPTCLVASLIAALDENRGPYDPRRSATSTSWEDWRMRLQGSGSGLGGGAFRPAGLGAATDAAAIARSAAAQYSREIVSFGSGARSPGGPPAPGESRAGGRARRASPSVITMPAARALDHATATTAM